MLLLELLVAEVSLEFGLVLEPLVAEVSLELGLVLEPLVVLVSFEIGQLGVSLTVPWVLAESTLGKLVTDSAVDLTLFLGP